MSDFKFRSTKIWILERRHNRILKCKKDNSRIYYKANREYYGILIYVIRILILYNFTVQITNTVDSNTIGALANNIGTIVKYAILLAMYCGKITCHNIDRQYNIWSRSRAGCIVCARLEGPNFSAVPPPPPKKKKLTIIYAQSIIL